MKDFFAPQYNQVRWLGGLGIVPLPRNDVSDAARRLRVIANVPRNQMYVKVKNRLPGSSADVDPNVEAIG
jgi:hypothetical protein